MKHIRELIEKTEKKYELLNSQIKELKKELKEYIECGETITELELVRDNLNDEYSRTHNQVYQKQLSTLITSTCSLLKNTIDKYSCLADEKIVIVNKYNELKSEAKELENELYQYKEFISYVNLKEYEEFQREITQTSCDDNVFVGNLEYYNPEDFTEQQLWKPYE